MKERRYAKPNLARNGTADDRLLEQSVFRAWLSYLLTHRDKLKPSQLHRLDTPRPILRDARWLENFSAYDVYSLAKIEWIYSFKGTKWESEVERWEGGEIDFIWLGDRYDLSSDLLELVLPRISRLLLGPNGTKYASRPTTGWPEALEGWREFVTKPVRWPYFVEFSKGIGELLSFISTLAVTFLTPSIKTGHNSWETTASKSLPTSYTKSYEHTMTNAYSNLAGKKPRCSGRRLKSGRSTRRLSRGSWPLRKFALAQGQDRLTGTDTDGT